MHSKGYSSSLVCPFCRFSTSLLGGFVIADNTWSFASLAFIGIIQNWMDFSGVAKILLLIRGVLEVKYGCEAPEKFQLEAMYTH